jgi:uncharacterized protein (DUF433 family)
MVELPVSKYIEKREGGYYIAGTRIGLAVLVEEFRGGESPEAILQGYPSIGSLCKVYGAITFVLENPEGIECYLRDQGRLWQELREKHPLPARVRDALLQAGKSQA